MNSAVPESLLRSLEVIPRHKRVSLLLRHAHRPPIEPGTYGDEVELSDAGTHAAEELGEILSYRRPGRVAASPVKRNGVTAAAIVRGAGWEADVVEDSLLGLPGPFVVDPALAGPLFLEWGPLEVVKRQLSDRRALPGMRPTHEGVSLLWDLMTGHDDNADLDIFVTHDSVIAAFAGYLLEQTPVEENWPQFLEGVFVWRDEGGSHLVSCGVSRKLSRVS